MSDAEKLRISDEMQRVAASYSEIRGDVALREYAERLRLAVENPVTAAFQAQIENSVVRHAAFLECAEMADALGDEADALAFSSDDVAVVSCFRGQESAYRLIAARYRQMAEDAP